LGAIEKLSRVYTELEMCSFFLCRLLGIRIEEKKERKVSKLAKNELLLIDIGSTLADGRVLERGSREGSTDFTRMY